MSTRIATEAAKEPFVISRADFEADLKRGYTVLEHSPATVEVIRDHRTGHKLERPIPAVLKLACMRCQWDTIAGPLGLGPDNARKTGEDLMVDHLRQEHQWPYGPFCNPYGHMADVVIEGMEPVGYQDQIKEI